MTPRTQIVNLTFTAADLRVAAERTSDPAVEERLRAAAKCVDEAIELLAERIGAKPK